MFVCLKLLFTCHVLLVSLLAKIANRYRFVLIPLRSHTLACIGLLFDIINGQAREYTSPNAIFYHSMFVCLKLLFTFHIQVCLRAKLAFYLVTFIAVFRRMYLCLIWTVLTTPLDRWFGLPPPSNPRLEEYPLMRSWRSVSPLWYFRLVEHMSKGVNKAMKAGPGFWNRLRRRRTR